MIQFSYAFQICLLYCKKVSKFKNLPKNRPTRSNFKIILICKLINICPNLNKISYPVNEFLNSLNRYIVRWLTPNLIMIHYVMKLAKSNLMILLDIIWLHQKCVENKLRNEKSNQMIRTYENKNEFIYFLFDSSLLICWQKYGATLT